MQNQQANKQMSPLVSFIIAYYNLPPQMLKECIESIRALSLTDTERQIIVVDDGSESSPLEAISHLMNHIIYLRQPNRGLSAARNTGLQLATGEYIQFVDADDTLITTPYNHCLDMVRQQHPDVVMFDFTCDNHQTAADYNSTDDPMTGADYLSHNNLQATACCYLFRQFILGNLRFTPGIFHEDEEFTPQLLLRAERILSTDAQAYYYRLRPASITTAADVRTTLRRLNDCHLVICKLSRIADILPITERQALQRRVDQLTMDYIYNIIIHTRSRHYLDRKLAILRREGLFPLPDRDYTLKYRWFRRLSNSSIGLSMLLRVLPRISKER